MSLFSVFRKKPETAPSEDGFPELSTGMRVEVLTPTGVPLFTGALRVLDSQVLEVRSEAGDYLPRAIYGQPVRLQGLQENGRRFTLDGSVGPSGPDFWRVERLRTLGAQGTPGGHQSRDHYRQSAGADGRICPSESFRGRLDSCKVLDISANGARVITKALYKPGDTFYLETALLPEESPFSIPCLVKRAQTHSKRGSSVRSFEYGCQFVDLPVREQERLIRSIFTLQRMDIQARRDR